MPVKPTTVVAIVAVVAAVGFSRYQSSQEAREGWNRVHTIGQGACDTAGDVVVPLIAGQTSQAAAYNQVADAMSALGATSTAMDTYDLTYEGSAFANPYDRVYAAMEDLASAIDHGERDATSRAHSRLGAACLEAASAGRR